MPEPATALPATIDLRSEFEISGVRDVLSELDRELIGLAPVKKRIRETAALLLVEKARKAMGLAHETPTLHMSFSSNPGTGKTTELLHIAETMLAQQNYHLDPPGQFALTDYIAKRRAQPHFANARSIRNALDRARLRPANRLFEKTKGPIDAETLSTISADDIRASRVFAMPGNKAAGLGEKT